MKGEEFYVPEDYMSLILELLNEFKIGLKVRTYDSMISALEEKLELEKNNKKEKIGIEEIIKKWDFAFEFSPLIVSAYLGVYFETKEKNKEEKENYGVLEISLEGTKTKLILDYHKIFFTELLRRKGLYVEEIPKIEEEKDIGIVVYNGVPLKQRIKNVLGGSYTQLLE